LFAGAFSGRFETSRFAAQNYGYEAACCAVLASAGKDTEATQIGIEEWGFLTNTAHRWLRDELALRAAEAKDPKQRAEVRGKLTIWKRDPELLAVRDPAWLAAMPKPDRKRWQAFWADVDALLAQVSQLATSTN
jgi:hypothetical protein